MCADHRHSWKVDNEEYSLPPRIFWRCEGCGEKCRATTDEMREAIRLDRVPGSGVASAIRFGVYRKLTGHTGVGMFYQFVCVAREHTTGEEAIVYIPLRVEPEWAGTVRFCYLRRDLFEAKFEFVGEGLPGTTP